MSDRLTTTVGTPIPDNQNSLTAGPRGPVLLQDYQLLEKLAHQNRERIPVKERTHELQDRNAELVTQTQHVRELTGRLLQMRDEERRSIARELHDSLGQIAAALSMSLATM